MEVLVTLGAICFFGLWFVAGALVIMAIIGGVIGMLSSPQPEDEGDEDEIGL